MVDSDLYIKAAGFSDEISQILIRSWGSILIRNIMICTRSILMYGVCMFIFRRFLG